MPSASGLGRRRWSSPQQCYLHCLSRSISPAAYYVSDVKLPTVHNVRDLGVLIDSHLSFRDHIN